MKNLMILMFSCAILTLESKDWVKASDLKTTNKLKTSYGYPFSDCYDDPEWRQLIVRAVAMLSVEKRDIAQPEAFWARGEALIQDYRTANPEEAVYCGVYQVELIGFMRRVHSEKQKILRQEGQKP